MHLADAACHVHWQECVLVIGPEDGLSVRLEDESKGLQSSVFMRPDVRTPFPDDTPVCYPQRVQPSVRRHVHLLHPHGPLVSSDTAPRESCHLMTPFNCRSSSRPWTARMANRSLGCSLACCWTRCRRAKPCQFSFHLLACMLDLQMYRKATKYSFDACAASF